jgi:NAD-dependent SIR2 family protein deacetylase
MLFRKNTAEKDTLEKVKMLKKELATADAIIVGAGAGLSTSAGLTYSGERFNKHFADFREHYGIEDMYSGGFYPFSTPEEFWAWWSRQIYLNRYDLKPNEVYTALLEVLRDKDYFVLTTNVDHQFQLAGFDKKRLFYTQGDYGLFQCSNACHNKTYDNEEIIRRMYTEQRDMKIPSELLPKCPVCGAPMTTNLRCDDKFVQDDGWYKAAYSYDDFIKRHKNLHILYLELGVGMNTPGIIKYPFWQMTSQNPKAVYACVNLGEALCPREIAQQSICINGDISDVINSII